MDFFAVISSVQTPLLVGVFVTLALCMAVVLTTRWHGGFSLDAMLGIQKMHVLPTSRVGGVPIMLGLVAAVVVSPTDLRHKLWPWLLVGIPAFSFGLAEDLTKRVSVRARLLATMGSGVLAWFITGYALTSVDVWGLDWLLQFTVASVVFTAFAVGGVANAINIIDGLNGLASSTVLWALLGIAVLAARLGDTELASTCLIISACVLGFFVVNWPFGKLFLGDGGSYFLGFALAWACVLLVERNTQVSAFSPLMLCIYPITELLYSVYRRMVRYQNLVQPDRLHLHSLVKRRVMPRLLPHSCKTVRNSASGLLLGSVSLLPTVLLQWVYNSTLASLATVVLLVLSYMWLYQRLLVRFGI